MRPKKILNQNGLSIILHCLWWWLFPSSHRLFNMFKRTVPVLAKNLCWVYLYLGFTCSLKTNKGIGGGGHSYGKTLTCWPFDELRWSFVFAIDEIVCKPVKLQRVLKKDVSHFSGRKGFMPFRASACLRNRCLISLLCSKVCCEPPYIYKLVCLFLKWDLNCEYGKGWKITIISPY